MRRFPLVVGIAALVVCHRLAGDWPQFQGPNRNGISPETGLLRAFPEGGPPVLWTVPLGQGYGGAAVQGGNVYVLDRLPGRRDVLRCLDLETGREEWTVSYEAPGKVQHPGASSTPTVDDRFVFTVGRMGHFLCVDKAARGVAWRMHLLDDFGGAMPRWGVAQAPLLYKDWVIVAPLSPTVGVAAFERATGKAVWKSAPIGGLHYSSPVLTTIDGVEQVVMITRDGVAGVEAAGGKVLWNYAGWTCRNAIPSPLPIGDGRILITGGYDVGSVMLRVEGANDRFAVTEVWRAPEIGSHVQNPLLYQGHLYLLCNTNTVVDGLVCMGLDGAIKWKTGRSPSLDKGNFLIADGVLFIVDGHSGDLRILEPSPDGYKELSRTAMLRGREIWGPMALADGKLLLRGSTELKCIRIRR